MSLSVKASQLCLILCDPVHCNPPGSSVHGIPQEYWSGLPLPSPGDLSDPGLKPASPALVGGFFTTESPGKPNQSAATQQKLKKVKNIRCRRSYQPFFSMNLCYQMTLNERCEQPLSPHGVLTVSPFLVM